ncbi:MAG: FAD-dependent oxidoreductase [Gemmataceae bacterium]
MRQEVALIVFSHLRWNFVYQRPQHLISRLAKQRRVIFIEEPMHTPNEQAHWERENPETNLTVCRAHIPNATEGFKEAESSLFPVMINHLLREEGVTDYVCWFYTPMAFPAARDLNPRAVIYDCMDELSAFLNAPPQILEREAQLLQRADAVFTGGPSLYRGKKDRHHNVHCFPSSVDAAHFGKARDGKNEPEDQAKIPHPRFGFFGVIDERLDIPLLDSMARARPDWQFVLVGPVVKIDPAILPRHSNIHYLGQRAYADLPAFLCGWDVCLLPFARNESTKFISPTKTLEYMAAEKPIVSTPITDVAEPYGEIVYLGDTPESFLKACESAFNSSQEERAARFNAMRDVLARTSWDTTAAAMNEIIEGLIEPKHDETASESSSTIPSKSPVVIVGAGPTGLSAAYHIGEDALIIEQNQRVGGWCRSIESNGFTFDFAGHIMFSNDPYVHELYEMLLGDNVHWQDREAWIYSKNVYNRYPFQGSLYGLPADVIKECLIGAIEARFGSVKAKSVLPATNGNGNGHSNGNGHAHNGNSNGNGKAHSEKAVHDCCADGIMESTARLVHAANGTSSNGASSNGHAKTENFEDFIYRVWGAGIAKHFAIPYNRKLWAVPLSEMETSWLGGRVPLPDLEEMIDGALRPVPKPMGPNARFGYPLRGGFQALMDAWVPKLKGPLVLGQRVAKVAPREHTVTLGDGSQIEYEQLISTMPLPVLIRSMGDEVPEEVRRAAAGLRYVSVRCVHLGVARENLTEKHWIYYPEDTVFHRIFVQGNASPHCNPPGGFGLTCEITYSEYKPLPCDGDALIQRCIEDCHRVNFFRPEDKVIAAVQCDMPHAYVVYDHARPHNVAVIREWLSKQDIVLAGRYSEWEYYNSDHAFLAGKKAADTVRTRTREVVANV